MPESPTARHLDLLPLLTSWRQQDSLDALAKGWAESMASLPKETLPFLDPASMQEAGRFAGLEEALRNLLPAAARAIASDEALKALAWHTYRRAYLEAEATNFAPWPELEVPLGEKARLFYLLLALASVPLMRRRHRELGIPEEIARATAGDVIEKCRRSALNRPDLPGLAPRELTWFQHHAHASVFRIGRLQYRFRPFAGQIRVYRHRGTGDIVAMADPDLLFDREGFRAADEPSADDGVWRSEFSEDTVRVHGHPISREGRAHPQLTTLQKCDWTRLAVNGDPAFEIHVPAGGGLTVDRCRASMEEAIDFHRRHFPSLPQPRIFSCISWFLGPQLQEILPPQSNIVQVQKAAYLFPTPGSGTDGFHFLFGRTELPANLPENASSLLTSIHRHLSGGGAWRGGGMFIPADRVSTFGTGR